VLGLHRILLQHRVDLVSEGRTPTCFDEESKNGDLDGSADEHIDADQEREDHWEAVSMGDLDDARGDK
jgi:hypothetical protein